MLDLEIDGCLSSMTLTSQLEEGECLGIVGESGSGKSLTVMAIATLLESRYQRITSESKIRLAGEDLTKLSGEALRKVRRSEIGVVFQDPMASLNPSFTIGEQIAERIRRNGVGRKEARMRAVDLLTEVGIPDAQRRARHYPHQFSGGMRQRVVIAIAISCEPKLIIADEPTTALDVTIQRRILDLFGELRRDREVSVILVSHDLGVIADQADSVAVMYAGQIVEKGRMARVLTRPLHPYTSALLNAHPNLDTSSEWSPIQGKVPSFDNLPDGCRFASRCEYCVHEICRTASVPLLAQEELAGRQDSVRCARVSEIAPELLT